VREIPLVQEVITSLGSYIRTNEYLFDGIVRIRTHFFIIAMREEISRMKGCTEEDAMEFLMQMSPFELKSLLGQILGKDSKHEFTTGPGVNLGKSKLSIQCQSGGFQGGNFARIQLLLDNEGLNSKSIFGRGMNIVVIDPNNGQVVETGSFDTHVSQEESHEFSKVIEWIDPGFIVIVVAKDEIAENLTESGNFGILIIIAILACESLGSEFIRKVKYRDSWCIIGAKGAKIGTVPEAHQPATKGGPTETILKEVNLLQEKSLVEGILNEAASSVFQMPCNFFHHVLYARSWEMASQTK
jgi:hypothetical protein